MKKLKVIYFITILLVLPIVAWAQPTIPGVGEVTQVSELYTRALNLARYAFGLAFAVCVVLIVWGAVGWATAGGDEEKMKTARTKLLYGIIGAASIAGVLTLISIIGTFFGLPGVDIFGTGGTYAPGQAY